VVDGLREAGLTDVPVIVGGIIPDDDAVELKAAGVAAVFTPKDYDATLVMGHVLDEIRAAHDLPRIFDFATHETVPVA
jgi:(2R)-ethylmalonyl-CoA mutase